MKSSRPAKKKTVRQGWPLGRIWLLLGLAAGLVAVLITLRIWWPQGAETAPQPAPVSVQPAQPEVKPGKKLYLIIDDAGQNLTQLQAFLNLPFPLAIAVIPGLPHSRQAAERARAAGKEVLLHLPMEPVGKENPGPLALLTSETEEQWAAKLALALADVPGALAVNNHMGSKATADSRLMTWLLGQLQARHLFFLDSLTTPVSESRSVGQRLNLRIQERDVFLDNERSREFILKALEEGKSIAGKKGRAVMIGHVWTSELAEVLTEIYPFLLDEGFTLEDIGSLLRGE